MSVTAGSERLADTRRLAVYYKLATDIGRRSDAQRPSIRHRRPALARSAEYYRDVLGFRVHEIGDPGWRFYERDTCLILAGECPDALPPAQLGDHSYFAYVLVEDLDSFFTEVTARGAQLIKPLRDEPWGMREFGIRTTDGHRMMFGKPIKPANPPLQPTGSAGG